MGIHPIEYIPILTTLFSIWFVQEIYRHYIARKTRYLLWWTIGVLTFGLGTLTESINVLAEWSSLNTRIWYIVGALLGGFPLAQGSVYLLMERRFADFTSRLFVGIIILASVFIFLTPVEVPANFDFKLTGKVFKWEWVRYFSPLINLYSAVFLIGGAAYSAIRYYKKGQREARFKGNVLIAIGALLPGIGGSMTRMGHVNVLFVTEFVGLVMIYFGYKIIKNDKGRTNILES